MVLELARKRGLPFSFRAKPAVLKPDPSTLELAKPLEQKLPPFETSIRLATQKRLLTPFATDLPEINGTIEYEEVNRLAITVSMTNEGCIVRATGPLKFEGNLLAFAGESYDRLERCFFFVPLAKSPTYPDSVEARLFLKGMKPGDEIYTPRNIFSLSLILSEEKLLEDFFKSLREGSAFEQQRRGWEGFLSSYYVSFPDDVRSKIDDLNQRLYLTFDRWDKPKAFGKEKAKIESLIQEGRI